jgi:cyclic-di-GMP phosphodiesterase TipF (flagellum assembly factor)
VESEHLAQLARLGYGFSIDNVTDLRLDPRELADRGVKFIKVPANMLLDQKQLSSADIHAADLSDLLGRFGIDLVAERIEGERAVVDLLDYDVRFGQGFLFAPPRPLRPEGAATEPAPATSTVDAPARKEDKADVKFEARTEAPRVTGNAALARRASAQK